MIEHRRPDGALAQGYFCARCGAAGVNMLASGHGEGKCEADPELVEELMEANKPAAAYFKASYP